MEFDVEAALREAAKSAARWDRESALDGLSPQERREAQDAKARAKDRIDMQKCLALPEFRRFMWLVLEEFGGMHKVGMHADHAMTAFDLGRRLVALKVLERIREAKEDAYEQVRREHMTDIKSLEAQAKSTEGGS